MFEFIKNIFVSNEKKTLGMSLLDEKRHAEAVEAFIAALEKSPDDIDILLNISHALFELKRHADAIEYLKRAASRASSINPVPEIMLGYAYYKTDALDESKAALERALRIDSKHPAARYYMGLLNLKLGNIDAATDEFEEVISEKPTFMQARLLAIGESFIIHGGTGK